MFPDWRRSECVDQLESKTDQQEPQPEQRASSIGGFRTLSTLSQLARRPSPNRGGVLQPQRHTGVVLRLREGKEEEKQGPDDVQDEPRYCHANDSFGRRLSRRL
jgi:hypothetical protein